MNTEQKTNESFVNPEGRIRGLEALYTKGDFYTIWRKTHKASKTSISFLEHVKRLNEIDITTDTPFVANIKGPLQANRLDIAIQYDTMVTLVIKQLTKLLSEAASGTPIGLTSAMSLEFYNLLKYNIIYVKKVLGGDDESTLLTPTTSIIDMYNAFVFLTKLEGHRPVEENITGLNFSKKYSMLPAFILAEGTRIHEMRHGDYDNKQLNLPTDTQAPEETKEFTDMENKLNKEEHIMKNETDQLAKEEVLNKHFDDNKVSFDDTELKELINDRKHAACEGKKLMNDINEGLEKGDAKKSDDNGVRTHIINNIPLLTLLKDMRILRHIDEMDGDNLANMLLEAKERYEKAASVKSLESLLKPLADMYDGVPEMISDFKVFFDDGEIMSSTETEMLEALETCYDTVLAKYPEVTPELLGDLLGAFHCMVITGIITAYETSRVTDSDLLNLDDVDDDTFDSILNEYTDELKNNAEKSTDSGVNRGSDDNDSGGNFGWWLLGAVAVAGIGYMAYNHWSTDSGDDVELLDLDELF